MTSKRRKRSAEEKERLGEVGLYRMRTYDMAMRLFATMPDGAARVAGLRAARIAGKLWGCHQSDLSFSPEPTDELGALADHWPQRRPFSRGMETIEDWALEKESEAAEASPPNGLDLFISSAWVAPMFGHAVETTRLQFRFTDGSCAEAPFLLGGRRVRAVVLQHDEVYVALGNGCDVSIWHQVVPFLEGAQYP